jgi:hypothetical protein
LATLPENSNPFRQQSPVSIPSPLIYASPPFPSVGKGDFPAFGVAHSGLDP